MNRVEPIVKIFKEFVVRSLLSLVKPYRDESEYGKALLNKEEVLSEKLNFVAVAADKLCVEIIKHNSLKNEVPPFSFSE